MIFFPAVVGLFPGPPPWSTCHCYHSDADGVMITTMMAMIAMMTVIAMVVTLVMMMMIFFRWPRMDLHLVICKQSLDEAVP